MRNLLTLSRREIGSIFLAPASYVILALGLGLVAFFFWIALRAMGGDISQSYRYFVGVVYFQLLLCVVPPLVTMRSLASERATGTLEMLLIAPVTDRQVVLSKFAGAFLFFLALWVPIIFIPVALFQFGAYPDFGQVIAFTIGVVSLGAFLVSVGIFTSSVTSNILTAFFAAFALDAFFLFGVAGIAWLTQSDAVRDWATAMLIPRQMDDFARGIVDVRYLIFYLTGTVLFLFLAVRSLESRTWR